MLKLLTFSTTYWKFKTEIFHFHFQLIFQISPEGIHSFKVLIILITFIEISEKSMF